jgi:diguanylate cyclase (GGDEF)-like protein
MIASPLPVPLNQKIDFLRNHARSLVPWPVACAALVAGLWGWSLSTIQHEETEIRESAYFAASAQARTYAEQLERSIGQLDYIMLSLQFHRQKSGNALRLEEQVEAGLVPKSSQISISVFDRNGLPVTSTSLEIRKTAGIASRDYFKAHAANPSKELVISKPGPSILVNVDVIILSRRLESADGTFAGVMVVAIEPDYLASFVNETKIGKDDFISIRRSDGAFFVAKTMEGVRFSGPNLRGNPQFPAKEGVRLTSASRYVDGKERIVAWHAAKSYPVVSVVGLSVATQLAGNDLRKREVQLIAGLGSFALFLVAAVGVRRAACRIWQTEYSDEVHRAYRLATENAREGFYMLRALYGPNREIADFLVEDCNERGALYRGLPREALIGSRMSNVLPVLFESHMLGACRTAMTDGFYEDEMHVPPNGSRAAQWLHRRLIRSGAGLAMTLRDVTETKAHHDALARMANEDALTSLPNRYWLTKYLPEALGDAKRLDKRLAIMFVDLDDFKDINDTLGHAAGDELLKLAALRLKAVIGQEDMVARLGGDEFTVVVGAAETVEEVIAVAERLIAAFSAPYVIGVSEHQCTVRASIGISMFPKDGKEGDTLLKQADIAMYSAKAHGKGAYCFFESRLEERLIARVTKQTELKQAIDRGELVLYYQPRVKATTGELTSMEALVRWIHPARGLISPDEFIPLAEETGLIVPLGAKVIDLACAQLAQWKADNLQLVPVSINVSAKQIDTGEVSAVLAAALKAHRLDASLVEVEITESATVGEGNAASAELAAIQAMGIKLYVDDFGTGYSCLAQLKRLDMDGLKIDRAFTSQLLNGADDAILFEAIVRMAHAFQMSVVAEGVETAEQLAALQALSCDEVQGYFVSKPVPASGVPLLFEKRFLFPDAHSAS